MGKFIKNKKIIFCLIVLGILITNSAVFALQVEWPDSPIGTPLNESSELPDLIKYLYEWGITLGGLAAFIALLIAGFQFLTSAGNPTSMADARGRMQSAGLGLVLLLSSWLVLNTINPELTTFQPLVMPEPTIFGNCEKGEIYKDEFGIEHERKGDEFCKYHFGDDYECKNDVCTIDLAKLFEVINCDSVSVRAECEIEGVTQTCEDTIATGSFTDKVPIKPNQLFELKAEPPEGSDKCMANLVFYERSGFFGGCGGDKRTLAIQPGTVSYGDFEFSNEKLDMLVNCIKLEKI